MCIVIDVVYVGTLNEHHYSVSLLMLENGKNVLCEEPFCQNSKQVKKLVEVSICIIIHLFLIDNLKQRLN